MSNSILDLFIHSSCSVFVIPLLMRSNSMLFISVWYPPLLFLISSSLLVFYLCILHCIIPHLLSLVNSLLTWINWHRFINSFYFSSLLFFVGLISSINEIIVHMWSLKPVRSDSVICSKISIFEINESIVLKNVTFCILLSECWVPHCMILFVKTLNICLFNLSEESIIFCNPAWTFFVSP